MKMRCGGFLKGFFTGIIMGSAVGMMLDMPDSRELSRMKRKTVRAARHIGNAVEDFIYSK